VRGGLLERLHPGGGGAYLVLPRPQVDPQRPQDLRFIIDDKHPCHAARPFTCNTCNSRSPLPATPARFTVPRP